MTEVLSTPITVNEHPDLSIKQRQHAKQLGLTPRDYLTVKQKVGTKVFLLSTREEAQYVLRVGELPPVLKGSPALRELNETRALAGLPPLDRIPDVREFLDNKSPQASEDPYRYRISFFAEDRTYE